jgi:peptide deformylase
MAKRSNKAIMVYPAGILRTKCETVTEINDEVKELAELMKGICKNMGGVGLSANQVGIGVRLMVVNLSGNSDDFVAYLNPNYDLPEYPATVDSEEGCLSLPGIAVKVQRYSNITATALGMDGNIVELKLDGQAAKIWQHECDHLGGLLMTDKVNESVKMSIRSKMKRIEKLAKKGII